MEGRGVSITNCVMDAPLTSAPPFSCFAAGCGRARGSVAGPRQVTVDRESCRETEDKRTEEEREEELYNELRNRCSSDLPASVLLLSEERERARLRAALIRMPAA